MPDPIANTRFFIIIGAALSIMMVSTHIMHQFLPCSLLQTLITNVVIVIPVLYYISMVYNVSPIPAIALLTIIVICGYHLFLYFSAPR